MLKSLSQPSYLWVPRPWIWTADGTRTRSWTWTLLLLLPLPPVPVSAGPPEPSLLPLFLESMFCMSVHCVVFALWPGRHDYSSCSACLSCPSAGLGKIGLSLLDSYWISSKTWGSPHTPSPLLSFPAVTCVLFSLARNLHWEWWVSSLRTAWLYQPSALCSISVLGTALILTLFL